MTENGHGEPAIIVVWKLKDEWFEKEMSFAMPCIPFNASCVLSVSSLMPPHGLSRYNLRKKQSIPTTKKKASNSGKYSLEYQNSLSFSREDTNDSESLYAPFTGNRTLDSYVQFLYTVKMNDEQGTRRQFTFLVDAIPTFLGGDWRNYGYSVDKPIPYDVWSCRSNHIIESAQCRVVVVLEETGPAMNTLSDMHGGRYIRVVGDVRASPSIVEGQGEDYTPNQTSTVEVFDLLLTRGSDPFHSPCTLEMQRKDTSMLGGGVVGVSGLSQSPPHGSLLRTDWVDRPPPITIVAKPFVIKECSCGSRRVVRLTDESPSNSGSTPSDPSSNDHQPTTDTNEAHHDEQELQIECGLTDSPHWDDFAYKSQLVRRSQRDLGWLVTNDWKTKLLVNDERIVFVKVRFDSS